jgi:transcriptional regulator with XRE-family HTH domain
MIPREESPSRDPEFLARMEKLVTQAGSRAALARATGVAVTTLQNWLNGNTEPSRSSLLRLARAGQVAVGWLIEGRGPELAGAPPRSYIEVVNYDLRKTGSLLRAMIGTPAEKRLIYQPDITHLASIQGAVAAVVATSDLEFMPEVPPDSVFLYDQMGRNPLVPSVVTTWDVDDRSIYFVADGVRLKLRRLQRRKDSLLVMASGGKTERTLTGAPDDFVLFGRVVWVAAVLPSARHPAQTARGQSDRSSDGAPGRRD